MSEQPLETLEKVLKKAKEVNKFFITVSYLDDDKIQHFYLTNNFIIVDLIPTLKHFAKKIEEKEIKSLTKWE